MRTMLLILVMTIATNYVRAAEVTVTLEDALAEQTTEIQCLDFLDSIHESENEGGVDQCMDQDYSESK